MNLKETLLGYIEGDKAAVLDAEYELAVVKGMLRIHEEALGGLDEMVSVQEDKPSSIAIWKQAMSPTSPEGQCFSMIDQLKKDMEKLHESLQVTEPIGKDLDTLAETPIQQKRTLITDENVDEVEAGD